MKKVLLIMAALCVLLAGCSNAEVEKETANNASEVVQEESGVKVVALPDDTMENLSDAILAVSLEEGGAYVDDTGAMQMDLKIYSYDKFDMVDMATMKVGDTIVTHDGEVLVQSLEQDANGTYIINGGLEAGGIQLATDESGVFYEVGFNDAKNWYEAGEATIRVSVDFVYYDYSDMDQGEVVYYPGSFLIGEVTDYHFVPSNTTIRVENGQIVEMFRNYMP